MKNKNRTCLLFFAALTAAASVLSACGDTAAPSDNEGNNTEPAVGAVTEAVTEDNTEKDNLPVLDFNGTVLRMAGQADHVTNDMDMWIEAEDGDVVRDAIYERNRAVEERFNVVIEKPLMDNYTNISNTIKNMVRAGEDGYEIIVNQLATSSADVLNGYFMNLNELPYLDFERSWYPASVVESATLDGKLFIIVSDMCLTYVGQTWSMCFNKDITTQNDIENLYDLVREGKWTFDKLKELSSGLYMDINGDGQRDIDDQYGFTLGKSVNGCMGAAFLYGAGQRFLDIADDHTIVNLMNSEHAQSLAQKITNLLDAPGSTQLDTGENPIYSMMKGRAVFAPAQLCHYYSYARDFNGTFGVLPMPKYDEAQQSYATLCDAGCNCITVPETCTNKELAGAMIEALSAYSHSYVIPAYVDIALQTKIARDEESVEMMQIVLDSRVMDFGYLYCGWQGWTWCIADLYKDTGKYMSTYEKKEKTQNKYYDKVIVQFTDEE